MPQTRLRQGVLKLGDFFEYFICKVGNCPYICSAKNKMVDVAQQVRASDCGSEGRRFEPDLPPPQKTTGIPVVFLLPYLLGKVIFSENLKV